MAQDERRGQVLFQYLKRTIKDFSRYVVVEVGAGTGYLSLNLAKHGAKKVVATDHDSAILKNLRQSVHINKVQKNMRVYKWDWNLGMPSVLTDLLSSHGPKKKKRTRKGYFECARLIQQLLHKHSEWGKEPSILGIACDTLYSKTTASLLPRALLEFLNIYPHARFLTNTLTKPSDSLNP
ncbi:hypothetical protein AAMO2058_000570800 [Amorphochlora amoebiformis]